MSRNRERPVAGFIAPAPSAGEPAECRAGGTARLSSLLAPPRPCERPAQLPALRQGSRRCARPDTVDVVSTNTHDADPGHFVRRPAPAPAQKSNNFPKEPLHLSPLKGP